MQEKYNMWVQMNTRGESRGKRIKEKENQIINSKEHNIKEEIFKNL